VTQTHTITLLTPDTLPLPKPRLHESCNGCGYCCVVEPCMLAKEFLDCHEGPCVALEQADGRTYCGLVRNPLLHLYRAHGPGEVAPDVQLRQAAATNTDLGVQFASTLRLGAGCDADDPD
jgi:hypothetical protein